MLSPALSGSPLLPISKSELPPGKDKPLSQPKRKIEPEEKDDLALGIDREQGLSNQFEDPGLGQLLDFQSDEGAVPLAQEVADAVHELILEPADVVNDQPHVGEVDLKSSTGLTAGFMTVEPGLNIASEANQIFGMEEDRSEAAVGADRMEMANNLFALVASDKSFPELVDEVLKALVNAIGAEAGSVLEMDHRKSEFFFRSCRGGGDAEKMKTFRVPAGEGIVGYVAESREPLLVKDMAMDKRQLRAISMTVGFEAKSCLAAPLFIGNRLYGVVELFNKVGATNGTFSEKDLETLMVGITMAVKVLEVRFLVAELARRAG